MVRFACQACGKQHTARDSNAGRQGVCNCGAVMMVPLRGEVTECASDGALADDVSRDVRLAWRIAVGGSIAGVVVIALVVYMLFFHNTWERDNTSRLFSLKGEADALARVKDYEKAKSKYEELFGLLANRTLTDEFLKSEMEAARAAQLENMKRLEPILAARAEEERRRAQEAAKVSVNYSPPATYRQRTPSWTEPQREHAIRALSDEYGVPMNEVRRGLDRVDGR